MQRSDAKWEPDDHRDKCAVCSKDFTWLLRRHHCRCRTRRAALEFCCGLLCASGFAAKSCVRRLRSRARAGVRPRRRALLQRMPLVLKLSRCGTAWAVARVSLTVLAANLISSPVVTQPHVCMRSFSEGDAADIACPAPNAGGRQRARLVSFACSCHEIGNWARSKTEILARIKRRCRRRSFVLMKFICMKDFIEITFISSAL